MNETTRSHLPSLLSAMLYIVSALLFFSVALLVSFTALGTFFAGKEVGAQQTILMTVSFVEALILTAAAFVAIQRYRQTAFAERASSFNISAWQVVAGMFVTGAALWIGYQIVESEIANWLLLPILTLPAVMLPLFILLGLAIRGLPLGTRWQSWNVFGLGMTLSPFILIFLEVFTLLVVLIIAIAVLMMQPGVEAQLERLVRAMQGLDPQSTAAQDLIAPYLVKPGVIAFALAYFALIVPMLEEIFKPLGVWLFARRLTSPAQGFALGALSGSAYALVETLGVSAQNTEWAGLLLSRIGTGTLHIATSALMGMGIAYAILERRYFRLLGIYILSVSLHGLWNAMAIFFAFSNVASYFEMDNPLARIGTSLNIGMVVLTVVLLALLMYSNYRVKRTLPPPAVQETPAEPIP